MEKYTILVELAANYSESDIDNFLKSARPFHQKWGKSQISLLVHGNAQIEGHVMPLHFFPGDFWGAGYSDQAFDEENTPGEVVHALEGVCFPLNSPHVTLNM